MDRTEGKGFIDRTEHAKAQRSKSVVFTPRKMAVVQSIRTSMRVGGEDG